MAGATKKGPAILDRDKGLSQDAEQEKGITQKKPWKSKSSVLTEILEKAVDIPGDAEKGSSHLI